MYEYRFKDTDEIRKSVYSWRLVDGDRNPNGKRELTMTDDVYKWFCELREDRFLNQSTAVIDGYSDFIFTSRNGKPMYPANINKALYRMVDKYNNEHVDKLPHLSNHIFRHTGCTRMAEAEVEPNTMRYVMGQGDMKMINKVYDHVSRDRVRKQMKKLDAKCLDAV